MQCYATHARIFRTNSLSYCKVIHQVTAHVAILYTKLLHMAYLNRILLAKSPIFHHFSPFKAGLDPPAALSSSFCSGIRLTRNLWSWSWRNMKYHSMVCGDREIGPTSEIGKYVYIYIYISIHTYKQYTHKNQYIPNNVFCSKQFVELFYN